MQPPMKKRRGAEASRGAQGGAELARALAWLDSYPKVSRWMQRYDLEALLEAGGGIAQVHDFLPPFVAEGALQILQGVPPGRWNDTAADEDYTHNNIAHKFWSLKGGGSGALQALLRAFSQLRPEQFNAFSAARYERDHHIAPHDDRAYTPVRLDTGEVVSCSRDLTCVYYLTKDWTEDMGGCLVDLEADPEHPPAGGAAGAAGPGRQHPAQRRQGRVYVPAFNSAVFFRVPRYHSVTPLRTDRPRFSVFGWFLQPGKLYELYSGQEEDLAVQAAYRQRQRAQAAAAGAAAAAAAAQEEGGAAAGEDDEQPLEPQRCKLGRRLLARAAAGSSARRAPTARQSK